MILLLDAGNTAIKWGVYRDGLLARTGGFRHRDEDFPSVAAAAWHDVQRPARVVVANVGGQRLGRQISEYTAARWAMAPEFVRTTAAAGGVINAYADPARLGVDRWAALIGARQHCRAPVCVIDCGSAITVDLLDTGGRHRGGVILPGIEMLQTVLLENTANIRMTDPVTEISPLARDTGSAVTSGAVYMAVAALGRVVADMAAATEVEPAVVVAGGDAVRILPLLNLSARHDPDLVLKGLAVLSGDT
ncbi:MAG: type III pantothenate kinase [Gammaproteobacteria bacterium]|jgi:type III pantothenate kinase